MQWASSLLIKSLSQINSELAKKSKFLARSGKILLQQISCKDGLDGTKLSFCHNSMEHSQDIPLSDIPMLTISQLLIIEVELSNTKLQKLLCVLSPMYWASQHSLAFPLMLVIHYLGPVHVIFLPIPSSACNFCPQNLHAQVLNPMSSINSSRKPLPHPCITPSLCTNMPGTDFS